MGRYDSPIENSIVKSAMIKASEELVKQVLEQRGVQELIAEITRNLLNRKKDFIRNIEGYIVDDISEAVIDKLEGEIADRILEKYCPYCGKKLEVK